MLQTHDTLAHELLRQQSALFLARTCPRHGARRVTRATTSWRMCRC